ncbi:MAG: trypsin-like peptidase domain-containing protein [Microcystis sp. M54BS1]|uniref:S1 family peptidase n=1 Tax=unclassified Microcystis TaxID=2643300 RepID=UPI002579E64F|nr:MULTISPECIES: serine protease [unclassified Microcystis]MCA2541433.1 trypsin-like peptidase domain-containing protein [Microcystis sp. M54BS1]MCA2596314.1 trypsin-like peptidase domain-containing protein [Microcystis sp. M38BS1]MCA2612534.1 trypsin-like peptidase domain-containing protein [Microcystis sp. M27BS1]MCA2507056.1 trypsin-like peptidase domain-containing protein [Microcystis sp. M62BS1]MCA2513283.1 trypsin-like peptidase domain-containing protein [Microcystis sp. M60BS1]
MLNKTHFVHLLNLLLVTIYCVGCQSQKNKDFPQAGNYSQPTVYTNTTEVSNTPQIKGIGKIGSGVVIAKDGDEYYVLTAKHLVNTEPGKIDDPYKIYFSDGNKYKEEYKIDYYSNVFLSENENPSIDLALVKFKSNKNHPISTFNRNIVRQEDVAISGWKSCANQPTYELTTGKVEAVLSPSKSQDGRNINYSNPTIEGMSGSGVFNSKNELVAIHSAAKKSVQYDKESCPKLDKLYGDNLGVSIKSFLESDLFKKLPKGSYKISSDSSNAQDSPITENTPQSPSNDQPTGIFKRPKSFKD